MQKLHAKTLRCLRLPTAAPLASLLLSACGSGDNSNSQSVDCSYLQCITSDTMQLSDVAVFGSVTEVNGQIQVDISLGQTFNLLT